MTNQNFYKPKLRLFDVSHGLHEFNFLKIYTYDNKTTLLMFDWNECTSDNI